MALLIILLILYACLVACSFSVCYIGHKRVIGDKYWNKDEDDVHWAAWMAIFWPLTVWFFAPWLYINLHKEDQDKQ